MLFLASSLFLIAWRVCMPSRRHCLGVFDHFLDLCLDCFGAYYMSIPKMNRSRRFTWGLCWQETVQDGMKFSCHQVLSALVRQQALGWNLVPLPKVPNSWSHYCIWLDIWIWDRNHRPHFTIVLKIITVPVMIISNYPWRILTVLLYLVCHGSHQQKPPMGWSSAAQPPTIGGISHRLCSDGQDRSFLGQTFGSWKLEISRDVLWFWSYFL